MRLIDADAVMAAHCKDCNTDIQAGCKGDPVCASMMWVVEAPTVDAVPVVRCKDCKHYRESEHPERTGIKFCYRLKDSNGEHVGYNYADNDFCSYGAKMMDGDQREQG